MKAASLSFFLLLSFLGFFKIKPISAGGNKDNVEQWGPLYVKNSLLTQRELSWEVPIDRLNHIGLNLSSGYFQEKDYSVAKINGIVDLIVEGYTRLFIDLYWEPSKSQWQFCPVSTAIQTRSKTKTMENDIKCASGTEFLLFLTNLNQYLSTLESTTSFFVVVLLFRLHSLDELGATSPLDALYDLVYQTLGRTIYTRSKLEQTRMNIPRSWLTKGQRYYTVTRNSNTGHLESSTAWPPFSYLYETPNRVILGYELDSGFNSSDLSTTLVDSLIFRFNELYAEANLNVNNGFNSQDCSSLLPLITPAPTQTANLGLSATHVESDFWSWRTIPQPLGQSNFTEESISALTQCGFSFVFKEPTTYNGVNLIPAIWSWEPNQPDPYGRDTNQRCAVMDAQSGRWKVKNCDHELPIACLSQKNFADWIIVKDNLYRYSAADRGCPAGYAFSIPTTARDNYHLAKSLNALGEPLAWIDLNSLSSVGCWVVGKNSVCGYSRTYQFLNQILSVSLIGGLITLVIFAVFVYFKCRINQRYRRSRLHREKVRTQIRNLEAITVPA